MQKTKFNVGDIITVANKDDPFHLKHFYEIVEVIDNDWGIPYSFKSLGNGTVYDREDLVRYIDGIRFVYKESPELSDKEYFESLYKTITENERLLYLNG